MSHIFISYKTEDRDTAQKVRQALRAEFKDAIWWDQDLQTGGQWSQEIDAKLSSAACVVVLWSKLSVQSQWVQQEAAVAKALEILAPAKIDDCIIPPPYAGVQAARLINWQGNENDPEFVKLVSRVKACLANYSSSRLPSPQLHSPPVAQPNHPVRRRSVAEIAADFLRDPIKFISLLVLLSMGAFWLVQLIYRYAPPEPSTSPQSSAEPIEQGSQEMRPSPVTFRDFVDFFHKQNNTDPQKAEFLKRHLNRRVTWEGYWVDSVSDRSNQEIFAILLASEGGSESESAFLSFPQNARPELAALGVGQKITVSCKLRDFDSRAFLTACELTKVEPLSFRFSANLPPFPENLDTIRPGMRLSEAKIVFPVGRLNAVAYSVELKHWPFNHVAYLLENGKEDPKIEYILFTFFGRGSKKEFHRCGDQGVWRRLPK